MAQKPPNALTILRRKQVEQRVGLSRSSIYLRMSQGQFPSPIALGGGKAVGWLESEVQAWIQARVDESRARKVAA